MSQHFMQRNLKTTIAGSDSPTYADIAKRQRAWTNQHPRMVMLTNLKWPILLPCCIWLEMSFTLHQRWFFALSAQ